MGDKDTSVLILSKDPQFSKSLEDYLHHQSLSEHLSIGSYEDVDQCIEHLSNSDKDDVVVINYDKNLAEELNQKTSELLQNITLIHYVAQDVDEHHVRFVKSGVKEYAVTGKEPFKRIAKLIKGISKGNKAASGFANMNYWLAAGILLVVIIVMVYLVLI